MHQLLCRVPPGVGISSFPGLVWVLNIHVFTYPVATNLQDNYVSHLGAPFFTSEWTPRAAKPLREHFACWGSIHGLLATAFHFFRGTSPTFSLWGFPGGIPTLWLQLWAHAPGLANQRQIRAPHLLASVIGLGMGKWPNWNNRSQHLDFCCNYWERRLSSHWDG